MFVCNKHVAVAIEIKVYKVKLILKWKTKISTNVWILSPVLYEVYFTALIVTCNCFVSSGWKSFSVSYCDSSQRNRMVLAPASSAFWISSWNEKNIEKRNVIIKFKCFRFTEKSRFYDIVGQQQGQSKIDM